MTWTDITDGAACLAMGCTLGYSVSAILYGWPVRRQPVRPTAPTGRERWIAPAPVFTDRKTQNEEES